MPAENVRADVLRLPDDLPHWAATLVEPLACVVRGQRWAGVGAGSRVAVVGAGAMGLLEVEAARAAGAAAVVAVEPRADRRALARDAGAATIAALEPAAARDALGGELADQVFVCTSDRRAIAGALHLAAPGGVVQLFAPTPPGELGADRPRHRLLPRGDAPVNLLRGPRRHPRRARPARRRAPSTRRGSCHTACPSPEVEEAFRLARSGEATKVVVEP